MDTSPEDLEFSRKLDILRRPDNATNFLFIGRAWLIIALTIGGFIFFDLWRAQAGLSIFWDLPLLKIAIIIIGASQHQLAGGGHEGTHFTLFRNRSMNEWISDWLCMFPILTSTSIYRKQHLAHHKYVNDPELDPDLAQLHSSKHDFQFPLKKKEVIRLFMRQLWIPNLIRYTIHRARYSAVGTESRLTENSTPNLLFFPYTFVLFATLGLLAHLEVAPPWFYIATAAIAGLAWTIKMLMEAIARRKQDQDKPEESRPQKGSAQRFVHITAVLLSVTLIHVHTGLETLVYFAVLWLIPLITSFSFFMMLRQTIQHGNCDRERYSNTRVFLVNPILRYAVFPFGMDYHLPHHLYAGVPHYHLPQLHELLMDQPAYRHPGCIVEGFFDSGRRTGSDSDNPSLISALGPEFSSNDTDS